MALIKPPPKKGAGGSGTGPLKQNSQIKSPGKSSGPLPAARPSGNQPASGGNAVMVSSGKVTLSTGKAKAGGDIMALLKGEAKEKEMAEVRSAALERIEEKVFQLPGMRDVVETECFRNFMEKLAPRMDLPKTSRDILEAFSNIDVTAEKLSQCLKSNPYYEFQFLKVIESMSKRVEMPGLEAAVILLGMQNSRNLILSLQLLRTVQGGHAEWTKEGKLKIAPSDVLRFALKTEEALQGNKSSYSDTAYAAGMMFDMMSLIAQQSGKESKKINAYIEHVYAHSLKAAQISNEIAKFLPDFGFKKYLYSACLIHDIGKIVMAILSPEYLDFIDDMAKKELPRAIRYHVEQKKFGVNHTVYGAASCRYFKVFGIIESAIMHHHEPYFIKATNKSLYQLASMVCLCTNIANNFKKVEKADDPVLALWRGPELKDFNIDSKQLILAVSRVV